MDLAAYLDEAKKRNQIRSDAQLASQIGIAGSTLTHYRNGRSTPTWRHMQVIARLAGVHEATAFLDWGLWQSGGGAQRPVDTLRKLLAAAIKHAAAAIAGILLLTWGTDRATAAEHAVNIGQQPAGKIYIMRLSHCLK